MTALALVGNIVDVEVEAALGLPRAPGGRAWNFRRAGLPHSLASEVVKREDRRSLRATVEDLLDWRPRRRSTARSRTTWA